MGYSHLALPLGEVLLPQGGCGPAGEPPPCIAPGGHQLIPHHFDQVSWVLETLSSSQSIHLHVSQCQYVSSFLLNLPTRLI